MKKIHSILLLLTIAHSVDAQTVTLTPSKDNSIYQENANSAGLGQLYAGLTCTNNRRRALLQFDLSSIPAGATITSVSLTLNCNNSGEATNSLFTLHALTTPFGEGTSVPAGAGGTGAPAIAPDATWANAQTPAPVWTTSGGDFVPTVVSSVSMTPSGDQTFPTTSDFVALVQAWYTTPALNFGMIVIGSETTACSARRFGSKDVGVAPTLVVSYTLPCNGPTAVCQDINVYLDATGNATITGADINSGSTDDCTTGSLSFSASQTTFSCADLPSSAGTLVITGVYDGPLAGGTPKGIELYVDGNIADLSAFGIGSANNGGGTDGVEFTFPAVPATDGSFIYVASESVGFTNFFGFAPTYVSGSMSINGDDAVELFQNGAVIDVFGDINLSGTGTSWEYLDGWAYRNDFVPNNNGVWTDTDFYYSGINALDLQLTNATAAVPVPIGTYTSAGSSIPVTLTVTDGLANTDQCTALVTVLDTLPPSFSPSSIDIQSECELTSWTAPTATDNCSGTITGTTTTTLPITATTVVVWTYTDAYGNTSIQNQNVIITDGSAPVANVTSLPALSNACEVTPTPPTATDACEGLITGTTTTTFPITSSTAIQWTYDDGNGNTSTQFQSITITGLDVAVTQGTQTLSADATGVSYQWIDCGNNTDIAGETNQSFEPSITGDYAVVISSGSCSDTSACFNMQVGGIESLIDLGMTVSPNPSTGVFSVTFDEVVTGLIYVYDANGRLVESMEIKETIVTIDLTAYQSGMYIMEVATEKGVSREQLVKY